MQINSSCQAVHKDLNDSKEVNQTQEAFLTKAQEVRKTAPISAMEVQRNLPAQPDLPVRPKPSEADQTQINLLRKFHVFNPDQVVLLMSELT